MSIPINEQETSIQFDRADDRMTVYTSDSTQMTKLDKKVKNYPGTWSLKEEIKDIKELDIVARNISDLQGIEFFTALKRLFSEVSGSFITRI